MLWRTQISIRGSVTMAMEDPRAYYFASVGKIVRGEATFQDRSLVEECHGFCLQMNFCSVARIFAMQLDAQFNSYVDMLIR